MIDNSTTNFKPQEMGNQGDSGSSELNFVSMRDNLNSYAGLRANALVTSFLPDLEIVENTSSYSGQRTSSDTVSQRSGVDVVSQRTSSDATRVRDRFGLSPEQRQLAERIESSILSGDLNALQKTMSMTLVSIFSKSLLRCAYGLS